MIREGLTAIWTTDAPPGMAWKCPDCQSWATLGGNAAFHAEKLNHGVPTLGPMPTKTAKPNFYDVIAKIVNSDRPDDSVRAMLRELLNEPTLASLRASIHADVPAATRSKCGGREKCEACGQYLWGYHHNNDAQRDAHALWDFLCSIDQSEKAEIALRLMTFLADERGPVTSLRYWVRSCAFRECVGHEKSNDRETCFRFLIAKAEEAFTKMREREEKNG